jgi:hypothetical protein
MLTYFYVFSNAFLIIINFLKIISLKMCPKSLINDFFSFSLIYRFFNF